MSGAGTLQRDLSWAAVATRALWVAVLLMVARSGLLYAMEHLSHRRELGQFQVRLANALPGIAVRVGLCALAVAVLTALLARRVRPGFARVALGVVLGLAAAFLFLVVLAGWDSADATRAVGIDTDRGRVTVATLGLGGIVLAAWLVGGLLRSERRSGWAAPLLPALLLLGLPIGWRAAFGRFEAQMTVVEVVGSLLNEPWEVVRRHPELEAHPGVICPCPNFSVDGADMPALILPPPAEVRLEFPERIGSARWSLRAGIDRSALFPRVAELSGCRVRFRVTVGGDEAAVAEIDLEPLPKKGGTAWVDLAGPRGLPLGRGDLLGLETTLLGPDGEERIPSRALKAGFGGLALERRLRSPRRPSSPTSPNIVLVVMDTLRVDRLSAYGYERRTSPHLERLAARGILYEEVYATSSWTWPSTASILTGLYPAEHGVTDGDSCYLAQELETLPEALQRAGLTTAAFSCNPLIVPEKNFGQGFEFFDYGRGTTRKSHLVMPAIFDWIEAMAGTRFFLYVHLVDPHSPYVAHPEGRRLFASDVPEEFPTDSIIRHFQRLVLGVGRSEDSGAEAVPPEEVACMSDLYDACVWTGDLWLGRLLDRIDALGLTDETIVVFTSDHGEELFDHGLAAHGHTLFGELVRAPLVMAGPGLPRGMRVPSPVSNRHLAPTLARLAGIELAGPRDAIDLARPQDHPAEGEDPIVLSTQRGYWEGHSEQRILGLRRGSFVLHYAPEGTGRRLFNLDEDPGELRDLAAELPGPAGEMQAVIERLQRELEARRPAPGVGAGEGTREMLREIGYAGGEE